MAPKTVFISSTYKDLADHRRAVWEALKKFDVAVRGMEEFGARTEAALDTCLAEVEQSDVYVGIIAFRIGSIDPESRKSFTQLEYEHAVERSKEVLIYLANEDTSCLPYSHIDDDAPSRRRLQAFKSKLRDRHTVDTFSTPEDLAAKLSRDFKRHFEPKRTETTATDGAEEFTKAAWALRDFRLTPKALNGHEIRLAVSFRGGLFPASRHLCQSFNLEYGLTVGAHIEITSPSDAFLTEEFTDLYATGNKVEVIKNLISHKTADLYALLLFSEADIKRVAAEFFNRSYHIDPNEDYDPSDEFRVYVPAEGKVILLLSKPA